MNGNEGFGEEGPGPRFEPESRDPQSPRITKLPYPGHDVETSERVLIHIFDWTLPSGRAMGDGHPMKVIITSFADAGA